jgi:3-oxoacyl-[acyl-carrier-protein] synthase II
MGAVTPLGIGVGALWDGWIAGRVAIEDGRGHCDDFTPEELISPRDAHRMDRFCQFAIVAAAEAAAQAGLDEAGYAPERTGCIIGTGIGGMNSLDEAVAAYANGEGVISPLAATRTMPNAAAAHVAIRQVARGPVFAPVSACAAGAHAVGLAARMIQYGEADVVVCGGSEAQLTPVIAGGMDSMGATSPTGRSLPFDVRRDGCVLSEAAGVLILEDAEAAAARGATVLGEVIGFGQTNDAGHISAPQPDGSAAAAAMRAAMRDAQIGPEDVDYVNAHGTATARNDSAETLAVKLALGDDAAAVPISSLKSSIGHPMGAAGAVEAIATVRALQERIAPPTLSLEEPDPELDLDYVPMVPRELVIRHGRPIALSNAFGFGGHNAVLAFAA